MENIKYEIEGRVTSSAYSCNNLHSSKVQLGIRPQNTNTIIEADSFQIPAPDNLSLAGRNLFGAMVKITVEFI
jgi:hypothetical protein